MGHLKRKRNLRPKSKRYQFLDYPHFYIFQRVSKYKWWFSKCPLLPTLKGQFFYKPRNCTLNLCKPSFLGRVKPKREIWGLFKKFNKKFVQKVPFCPKISPNKGRPIDPRNPWNWHEFQNNESLCESVEFSVKIGFWTLGTPPFWNRD